MNQIDAVMDPWSTVEIKDGTILLFGFVISHPVTGGLSWTRTSPVVELNRAACTARTASGRRYRLGEQVGWLNLPNKESRFAFALLVGSEIGASYEDMVGTTISEAVAATWLVACKMARHLGLEQPDPSLGLLEAFIAQYQDQYVALRSKRLHH